MFISLCIEQLVILVRALDCLDRASADCHIPRDFLVGLGANPAPKENPRRVRSFDRLMNGILSLDRPLQSSGTRAANFHGIIVTFQIQARPTSHTSPGIFKIWIISITVSQKEHSLFGLKYNTKERSV